MSDYSVYLLNRSATTTKPYDDILHLQNPEYDKLFGFFHTDLIVAFTGFWDSGGHDYLFYHPGRDKAILKSIAGLAVLLVNSVVLVNTARGHYQNILKTEGEQRLASGFLGALEVSQLSGRRLSDAAYVWKYLTDSSLFPYEGYYIAGSSGKTVQYKGQIKTAHLKPYPLKS